MLKQYTREELKKKSMLGLASLILKDTKKAIDFQELYNQIAELKGLTKKAKEEQIAQFYTELNVDGRFIPLGSNVWGLKEWYPVDQADEQITDAPKKRKKKKTDDLDDELEYEEDLVELGEEEEDEDEDEEEIAEADEFDEEYDEDLDDEEEEEEEEELDIEIDLDEEDEEEE